MPNKKEITPKNPQAKDEADDAGKSAERKTAFNRIRKTAYGRIRKTAAWNGKF